MTHTDRCAFARSKRSRCRCSCGGILHGRHADEEGIIPGERVLTEEMGGEVADLIRRTVGRDVPGDGICPHITRIGGWLGYPHDGGLRDAEGKTWWAYLPCLECHNDISWWKVERRLEVLVLREIVTFENEVTA